MSLLKIVLIKSVGVPASFHTVTNVTLNKSSDNASVNIASYYSQDVYAAGANPLAQSTVIVAALPKDGQDVWAFADEFLAKAAPDGADTSAVLEQFSAVNPYVFAGATIV
jgi:hypothetical protein